jgi:predicted AAA+ superfamily ATPase
MAIPLHRAVQRGEPILLQGPRSAGKTTLLQREFPGHTYVSLDIPADRVRARNDPASFIARLRGPSIIDDAHRAPELFPHLNGPLILASSRRLNLPIETLELHPPTSAELERRAPLTLNMLGRFVPAAERHVAPFARWPARRSFLEYDVRDLNGVRDLDRFELFLQTARQRSAQILDQQAIANECEISHRTVTRWLAVLDACFLTLRLPPAEMDFNRRIVRSPKLHFMHSENFESRVVAELFRNAKHEGEEPDLRYWRDSNGFEIPLVVQSIPVGIAPAPIARVKRWMDLAQVSQGALIGQSKSIARSSGGVLRYSIDQL